MIWFWGKSWQKFLICYDGLQLGSSGFSRQKARTQPTTDEYLFLFIFPLCCTATGAKRKALMTNWLICVIETHTLKCGKNQLSCGQSCQPNQHFSSAELCLPSVSAWFWVELNISKNVHGLHCLFAIHASCKTSKHLNTCVLELNKRWMQKTDLQFTCELETRLGSCLHFGENLSLYLNMRPTVWQKEGNDSDFKWDKDTMEQ